MARYSKILINVPDVNRAYVQGSYKYSSPNVIADNKQVISNIQSNLGSIISKYGAEFEIDDEILIGFIATESGGKNAPSNQYDATGYMQITPVSVYETITKWEQQVGSPLPPNAKAVLKKYIPSSITWDKNTDASSSTLNSIKTAAKNADFNIAMGSAMIRWMLEAFSTDSNTSYLNKVMIGYNMGYYNAKNRLLGDLTSDQILAIRGLGAEPKAYILKMLGVYGFLDLMFNR